MGDFILSGQIPCAQNWYTAFQVDLNYPLVILSHQSCDHRRELDWPHDLHQLLIMSLLHFFKSRFTPCEAEQPPQGIELQEKEAQKD